jgi:hypothetical protein
MQIQNEADQKEKPLMKKRIISSHVTGFQLKIQKTDIKI